MRRGLLVTVEHYLWIHYVDKCSWLSAGVRSLSLSEGDEEGKGNINKYLSAVLAHSRTKPIMCSIHASLAHSLAHYGTWKHKYNNE